MQGNVPGQPVLPPSYFKAVPTLTQGTAKQIHAQIKRHNLVSLEGLSEKTIMMFGAGEIFPMPELGEVFPADLDKVINGDKLLVQLKKTKCASLLVPERTKPALIYNLKVLNFVTGGNFFLKMLQFRKLHQFYERNLNKTLREWDNDAKQKFKELVEESDIEGVRKSRRKATRDLSKVVQDLFQNGRYADIIACRSPGLPGYVDQTIEIKATGNGINMEATYTRMYWTKPIELVNTVRQFDNALFENDMERFQNLFCKKQHSQHMSTVYYILFMDLPSPWNVKMGPPFVTCLTDMQIENPVVVKIQNVLFEGFKAGKEDQDVGLPDPLAIIPARVHAQLPAGNPLQAQPNAGAGQAQQNAGAGQAQQNPAQPQVNPQQPIIAGGGGMIARQLYGGIGNMLVGPNPIPIAGYAMHQQVLDNNPFEENDPMKFIQRALTAQQNRADEDMQANPIEEEKADTWFQMQDPPREAMQDDADDYDEEHYHLERFLMNSEGVRSSDFLQRGKVEPGTFERIKYDMMMMDFQGKGTQSSQQSSDSTLTDVRTSSSQEGVQVTQVNLADLAMKNEDRDDGDDHDDGDDLDDDEEEKGDGGPGNPPVDEAREALIRTSSEQLSGSQRPLYNPVDVFEDATVQLDEDWKVISAIFGGKYTDYSGVVQMFYHQGVACINDNGFMPIDSKNLHSVHVNQISCRIPRHPYRKDWEQLRGSDQEYNTMDSVSEYETSSRLYKKVLDTVITAVDKTFLEIPSLRICLYEAFVGILRVCQTSSDKCKHYQALVKEKAAIAQRLCDNKSLLSADSVVLLEAVSRDSIYKATDLEDSVERFSRNTERCLEYISHMHALHGFWFDYKQSHQSCLVCETPFNNFSAACVPLCKKGEINVEHAIHLLCRLKLKDSSVCPFDTQKVVFHCIPLDPDTDKHSEKKVSYGSVSQEQD